MKKRVLSVILSLMLIIGMLPMTAFAQEASGSDIVSFSDTAEEMPANEPESETTSQQILPANEAVSATEQTTEQTTEFAAEQQEEAPLSPTEAEPEDILGAKAYTIFVGFEPFTTSSQQEINLDSGIAKLDTTTTPYTLTLTNASTAYGYSPEDKPNIFAGIYSTVDLKIVLVGNSYLTMGSASAKDKINYGICAPGCDITFEGDGKLTIDIAKRDGYGCSGIYCSTATFNGGTYDISVQTNSSENTYAIETEFYTQINGGRFLLEPDTEYYGADYGNYAYAFKQSPYISTTYQNSAKIKVCDERGNDFVDWDGSMLLNNYCGVRINEPGYGIWVNGKEFSPSNTRFEFADGGVASYEIIDYHRYIVLDNVNITKATQIPGTKMYAGIWTNSRCPSIMLIGENSIELTGSDETLCGILSGIVDNTAGFSTSALYINEDSDKCGSLKIDLKGSGNCYGTYGALVDFNSGDCDFYAETSKSTAQAIAVSFNRYVSSLSGGNQKLEAVNTGGGTQKAFAFDPEMTDKYLEKNNIYVSNGSQYSLWDGVTPISNYSAFMSNDGLHYGVWVNGVEFTEKTTRIACDKGNAVLDTSTTPYTLTLNNVYIDKYVSVPNTRFKAGIWTKNDLKIVLEGKNYIGFTSNVDISEGILAYETQADGDKIYHDLTFEGSGELEVFVSADNGGNAIHCNAAVFNGGTYDLHGHTKGSGEARAIYTAKAPQINGGNFTELQGTPVGNTNHSAFKIAPVFSDAYKKASRVLVYENGGYKAWDGTTSLTKYTGVTITEVGLGVWVNGVQFSDVNAASGIKCGSGKATLDKSTTPWTVTLTDATITDVTVQCPFGYDVYAGGIFSEKDINIKVVGNNSITTSGSSTVIGDDSLAGYAYYACIAGESIDVTITGTGDLELDAYKVGGVYLESDNYGKHGVLTIDGGNITGKAEYMYCNGEPGISYISGSLELYNTDPDSRFSGFLVGSLDDTYCDLPYELWLYDYHEDGQNPEWKKCTIKEFEDFYEENDYSHSEAGIRIAPVDAVVVSWYLDAADELAVAGIEIAKGSTYGEPLAPGKDGYVFDGWYTDRALTKKWVPGSVVNADLELFPKWISTASFTLSPDGGCEAGQKVTMTASGGSTYKFYYECAGAWVRIQDFSTKNTCTWTPSKAGTYTLYCDIKNADGDVECKKLTYTVTGTEPLKVTLSFQYASPQKAGTTIKITANATGGKGALKYKFYSECNGVWTKLWDYDTRVSYNWHATTVGTHTLYCDVMDETDEVVCAVVKYNIVKGEDFVADLNANRISGQLVGTEIRLLGGSSNGTGTVQYKFYYEVNGNWVKLQDFSTQDYCLWTPTKAGYYNLYMDAKDSAGNTASKRLCITIDEGQTLKVTSVTFNPTTGKTGTSTTITAKSTGGSGTVTYKFYYEMNGAWVKLQDFSEKKTCTWKPTKAGTYHIYVDAIDGTKNTQCLMINYVVK